MKLREKLKARLNRPPKPPLTTEEKLDKILDYQRKMHFWAVVKALTNVTLFLLFIVLPIIGIVYFFDWAKESLGLNLDQFKQTMEGLKALGGSDDLSQSANELLDLLKGS